RVRVAGEREREAPDLAGTVAAPLDEGEQPGQRGARAAARRLEQVGDGGIVGTGQAAGTLQRERCALELLVADVEHLGDTLDAVLQDALDAGLQRDGGGGAADARTHQLDLDDTGGLVDVAQVDVATVGLDGRPAARGPATRSMRSWSSHTRADGTRCSSSPSPSGSSRSSSMSPTRRRGPSSRPRSASAPGTTAR